MVQKKVLLDSNAYFRLAPGVHPFLFDPFGKENYCLYVIEDFEVELKRSPRLRTKFAWAFDPDFIESRKRTITISRKQKTEITDVFDYMWGCFNKTGVSEIDVKAVATAMVLKVQLVSDDIGVKEVAKEYGVTCHSTIKMLYIMEQNGHITMDKVRATIQYLRYDIDTCHSFKAEYVELFGEDYPTYE